jgi:hypothetical protein
MTPLATPRPTIYAPACDVSQLNGAVINHVFPTVQVVLGRGLGHPCGPDVWNAVTMYAGTSSQLIPQALVHAPLGPIDGLYYWGPVGGFRGFAPS